MGSKCGGFQMKLVTGSAYPRTLRFKGEPLRIRVGRDARSHLMLFHGGSSRGHAEIVWDGKRLWVEDRNSHNGTLVDGKRIDERTLLDPGARVSFGVVEFNVEALSPEAWEQESTRLCTLHEIRTFLDLHDGPVDTRKKTSSLEPSALPGRPDATRVSSTPADAPSSPDRQPEATVLWTAWAGRAHRSFFGLARPLLLCLLILPAAFLAVRMSGKTEPPARRFTRAVQGKTAKPLPMNKLGQNPFLPSVVESDAGLPIRELTPSPAMAADALISGQQEEARILYRALKRSAPYDEAYSTILRILENRVKK